MAKNKEESEINKIEEKKSMIKLIASVVLEWLTSDSNFDYKCPEQNLLQPMWNYDIDNDAWQSGWLHASIDIREATLKHPLPHAAPSVFTHTVSLIQILYVTVDHVDTIFNGDKLIQVSIGLSPYSAYYWWSLSSQS